MTKILIAADEESLDNLMRWSPSDRLKHFSDATLIDQKGLLCTNHFKDLIKPSVL